MLELRTFGGLALSRPQQPDPQALHAQPKRLALLAYLALARPRGYHRRDTLLAMFWPEADESHARQALRQAVYVLRNELGDGIVVSRGEEEIGLNWDMVGCDAAAFDEAVRGGDHERALDIYQAELLPGFHLADAPDFVRFVDTERAAYCREAAAAAWHLAVASSEAGDAVSATRWARRAVAIEPHEEERLRTVIAGLDALGERAAAIGLFEDFSQRLADQYQLEPAPETIDLVTAVRARSSAPTGVVAAPQRQEAGAAPARPKAESTWARLWRRPGAAVATAVVAVALAWIAFGLITPGHAAPRIAVLPLENLGEEQDAWFAEGMTDEITSRLANVGGLAVIARQSTSQYRGSTKPAGMIAQELDADYLLEGTVQTVHAGDGSVSVRIRPQLITASDQTHVWAGLFTVPLLANEIFRVQSEVADSVARALNVTIPESERSMPEAPPTASTEAYEFFLHGREYEVGAAPEQDLRIAVQMYERAVELDSSFAAAYAALAEAHLHLWWRFYDRSAERLASAKASLDRALALDSMLPEAQIALGYYYYWGLLELDSALEVFEAARSKRPRSADLLHGIGSVLRRRGQLDEALAYLLQAADVNPRSALVAREVANTYAFMRNREEAERYFHRAIELDPGWPTYLRDALRVHLRLDGSTADARRMLAAARDLKFEHPLLSALGTWIEASDGYYDVALDLIRGMSVDAVESNSFYVPKAQLYAEVYGLLGNDELRRAYYDSSRVVAETRLRMTPDDARVHSALGIADAGLGRRAEALHEGERAVALRPVAEDAWHGVYRVESLAVIHAMLGEDEEAIELLEYLLSIPGTLTVPFLKIDYRFNSLRDHPSFQELLERYD